jgi:hypothetical protein
LEKEFWSSEEHIEERRQVFSRLLFSKLRSPDAGRQTSVLIMAMGV